MSDPGIAIVGVGGAGQSIVNYLKRKGINGADKIKYIAANCDWESLKQSQADSLLPIGKKSLSGLDVHGDIRLGRDCAIESRNAIKAALADYQLVFIVAGLGGGTGTGAAIEIARMSSDLGAITVALVTLPFSFEGENRKRIAEGGLAALRRSVDAAIALPNEWLRRLASPQITMKEAFDWSNDYIRQIISGLIKLSRQTEKL